MPAEGAHFQGAKEGRIEDIVFVLSNLGCSEAKIMPAAGKHLEIIVQIAWEGALLILCN